MQKKVKETLIKYSMVQSGEHVLVAVSGGADSVALLCVLHYLSGEFDLKLTVAHFNHGLRKEAEEEELFVKTIAQNLGLPCLVGREEVRNLKHLWKCSLEEAARIARYHFLEEAARACGAKKIALGHNERDQAETVLINILRGTGLKGLKGMEPVRDGLFIRPLLYVSPREITSFLAQEGLKFCTDRSNFDQRYLRNRIRHFLLPVLEKEFNPRIVSVLSRMADILREENEYLESAARGIAGRKEDLGTLQELPPALRRRVIKVILEEMRPEGKAVTARHINAVEGVILSPRSNPSVHVPGGVVVKENGILRFHTGKDSKANREGFSYLLSIPGEVRITLTGQVLKANLCLPQDIPNKIDNPNVLYLNLDKIKFPLRVRSWRFGDRMQPLGMRGTKKVKEIFQEMRVPPNRRHEIPLLEDELGILWVSSLKVGERCRLEADAKRLARIEII